MPHIPGQGLRAAKTMHESAHMIAHVCVWMRMCLGVQIGMSVPRICCPNVCSCLSLSEGATCMLVGVSTLAVVRMNISCPARARAHERNTVMHTTAARTMQGCGAASASAAPTRRRGIARSARATSFAGRRLHPAAQRWRRLTSSPRRVCGRANRGPRRDRRRWWRTRSG